MQKYLISVAV